MAWRMQPPVGAGPGVIFLLSLGSGLATRLASLAVHEQAVFFMVVDTAENA